MTSIETPRLILRPFEKGDLDSVVRIQGDADVMAHYGGGSAISASEAARVLEYHIRCRAYPYWAWAVTLRSTKECIGQVTAGFTEWHDQEWVEVAWILAKEIWGQGFGSEAVAAMLEHGGEEIGWKRVLATVSPGNQRSVRVIEKLAFEFAGEETSTHGTPRRCYTRILAGESTRYR